MTATGFLALGVRQGDEVITVPQTFIGTTEAITQAGGTIRFVDIDPQTHTLDPLRLEAAVTARTVGVVPVHLYGRPADMDPILDVARRHGLWVVEDAAQAHGAKYKGRTVGTVGDAGCFSFYPTKNLGACGDGGMVLTNRQDVAERLTKLRHHGDSGRYQHEELGFCSRLDEMQAAVLRVKLARLPAWTQARRRIAARYRALLAGASLTLPTEAAPARHVFHLFTVRHPQRDALAKALTDRGIGTGVYYPRPVPAQPVFGLDDRRWPEAARAAREVLSLPCFAELSDEEVEQTAAAVRSACEGL